MQFPNDRHREKQGRKINDDVENTIRNERGSVIEASTRHHSVPLPLNRITLEHVEQEDRDKPCDAAPNEDHGRNLERPSDEDTAVEQKDGDFDSGNGEGVCHLCCKKTLPFVNRFDEALSCTRKSSTLKFSRI